MTNANFSNNVRTGRNASAGRLRELNRIEERLFECAGIVEEESAKEDSRSSRVKITSMRNLDLDAQRRPLLEQFFAGISAALSGFSLLFFPKQTNAMCKNYGHIIDHKRWGTGLPKCQDCGAEIKDPGDLRRASTEKLERGENFFVYDTGRARKIDKATSLSS
jgi:hypothetical protein